MKFNVDKQENVIVYEILEDKLTSANAPILKSELVLANTEGYNNIIIDLNNVRFVDSSGLSAILTADRLMKTNGSFVLTGIEQAAVKKLFEISRLDSVLSMVPTKAEAVEYVFMEELQRELEADGDDGDEGDEDE